jgi:hypothetical protein
MNVTKDGAVTTEDNLGSLLSSGIARKEALAAQARQLIDWHGDDWDAPHSIITVHPGDEGKLRIGKLRIGTWMMVALDVEPSSLPALLRDAAAKRLAEHPDDPPYAYGFCIEAFFLSEPSPGAGNEARLRFEQARATQALHQHPDAVEVATAWVADIHGRAWQCRRQRDTGEVTEKFYPPGSQGHRAGGALVTALITTARATGITAWGLPG